MNNSEPKSKECSTKSKPSEDLLKHIAEQHAKVFAIRQELTKETDRGCALMAAAFLDNELMLMLSDKIIGPKRFKQSVFEFNGPLGSFSSRIKMGYSLGLISKEILEDLDLIRKVRNEFGHRYEPISFESEPVKSWIIGLKQTFYKKNEAKPRSIFNNTVLGVLAHIHGAFLQEPRFKEKRLPPISAEEKENVKDLAKKMIDNLFDKVPDPESKT